MTVQEAINNAKSEVEATKTVNASVRALVSRLGDIAEENKNDPEEIQAFADILRNENLTLAQMVESNTPAPAPPVDPPIE